MSAAGALIVFLLVTCALVPLIQRDLRRAAWRRRARLFWADRHDRIWAQAKLRRQIPDEEFARGYLNAWTETPPERDR